LLPGNVIIERAASGEKSLGCWLTFPSTQIVELAALAGFHFVQIDGEHGPFDPDDIEQTCLAAQAVGLTVTARPPSINPAILVEYLDRGVQGIMGPHVETPEEATAFVRACRFGPEGERSWGGGRALHYNDPASVQVEDGTRTGLMSAANAEIVLIAQLETELALASIDDLMAVPGIDYFAFGPNDLAQSMGMPGRPDDPAVRSAMAETVARVHAAGRKMMTDDTAMTYAYALLLEAGRAFVENH
jgi:2-keto-3-deoxy-L-rhamnonate aldolase RhmA